MVPKTLPVITNRKVIYLETAYPKKLLTNPPMKIPVNERSKVRI